MALLASFSPSSSSSSCSFSSSSISYVWKYHVFLSFRGPDTRHGFTGHLHKALSDKGIRTFIDDEELQRGEEITPSLVKAIEESRIAIPVFSKSYASSSFCLDELVKIMECVKGKGRLVLPVFYDVDPRDVRRQSGSYGEALARHEQRFKDDRERVQKWREALNQAANLSGEDFKLGNEYERDLIVKIVNEISKRISRGPLHVANYPVGMESRLLEVNWLLNNASENGVHMVGIYGIGGIGKTTLAKVVYNSIADQFEGLCFLENMSELSVKNGLPYLQKMLLFEILGEKNCDLGSVTELIPIISERLRCKKVLLVLDNVDNYEQLQAIIGRPDWLGSGSRVIITTRNKHLLTMHEVKEVYEVGVLNEEEALELFTWMAFKSKNVEPCYMDILKKLVTYASGLPLALEVIGSSLFGRCVEEWKSALDEYQKIPNGDVQKKLRVSFDALHLHEKNIFLDIACCFKGYELREVVDILHGHYDIDPTYTIQVLADKSLIKINGFHVVITLHDLIQDMGREIVHLESPEKPGARSRLWLAKDIIEVLEEDEGSSKIQLINLECDDNGDVIEWDGLAFKKMDTLRTLIIKNSRFSQGPIYLPSSLRVVKWEMHPSQEYLSFYFRPRQLVILDLSRNCFDSVQMAELLKKKLENMRVLRFDYCGLITKIPNLSSAPKLEELSFEGCDSLTEIDESVGCLDKLKTLNAYKCSQLRSLPPLMLPSLKDLKLSGCSSLESFPEILGKMESMTMLWLYSTAIKKFPYSIHNLTGLRSLYMSGGGIVELPSSITLLEQVETLSFGSCKGLLLRNEDEGEEQVSSMSFSNKTTLQIYDCNISEEFFQIAIPVFPRFESLRFKGENFRILPKCIEEFQFLRKLHLFDSKKLEEIRGIPPNIEELFVVHCTSLSLLTREMLLNQKLHEEGQDKMFILPEPADRLPMWFEYRRRDLSIAFWFRNKFPAICFGLFTWSDPLDQITIRPRLTINGAKSFQLVAHDYYESLDLYPPRQVGHILIFSKTETTFRDQVGEGLSENEWKCAVFAVYDDKPFNGNELDYVQVGIHIIKEKSSMDDIRFTDPLSQNQCDTLGDMEYSHETHTQFVQQQTYSARFLEWQCDTMRSYSHIGNVRGLQKQQNFRFWYKQEEQNLTSIDQHNLEGRESFGEGNGKNPLTELLSTTKKKFENMRVLRFDYCEHITKIPNLSSAPKLEVLSFVCCYKLTEIDESVGSLDKLKTLDACGCSMLRSLPPLLLPSLKYLSLNYCSSLESFPEILGKMECVMHLFLSSHHIKKFPYSIHNLTRLQSLSLRSFGAVELPNSIMLPAVERLSFNCCEGLLLPIQGEGEEQVSSIPFSNTAFLRISGCNISEEFLRIALPMFPRLQFLCLQWENFRILPECIREFQFLRRLHLILCEKLEEIRGIPPNIEELRVTHCGSLSSSTRDMLLNKKLYEEGQDKRFILPGERLPVWFEYQRRESSITFWIRNKFPAISFGVLNQSSARFIRAKLTINGTKSFQLVQYHPYTEIGEDGFICIFSTTQTAFRDQVDEALSENEWNRAVFSVYYDVGWWNEQKDTVEVGVHIIKERSSVDDIRFTDPLPSTFNDNVNTTTTLTVQDLQEQRLTSINPHSLEGCESVTKAKGKGMVELTCNGNAAEDDGKKPITENLSATKAVSGSYESSFHSESVDQLVNSLVEIQAPSPQPLDPLAELERVLLGSYDLPPESTSPTAASSSDIQASEAVIILQNLELLLDNPLESLIADGGIKHQILHCLSKLGLLEDHIPIPLQSIVAQVRDFYEDLINNFPSVQQTLVDYSCLEETRTKFLENLYQAKAKQAQIDAEVLRGKVQAEELDAETGDLEIKLKAAVEKRNELKLAIKNGEAEKDKLLKDAYAWLMESKRVVKKIKSSEHACRDAQNSKARLEGRLATLKGAFAANNNKG